ncbi:MAG TPA: class I SAM-dependent methyltransferase [Ilumatobacteraceae bacterium]|nr:class I SAM-dependent methyltransferase [Ilumatobacteraceae bacterium]
MSDFEASMVPGVLWFVDSPQFGGAWEPGGERQVVGWVASREPISQLRLTARHDSSRILSADPQLAPRPDVDNAFGLAAIGFTFDLSAPLREATAVRFHVGGRDVAIGVPHLADFGVGADDGRGDGYAAFKRRRIVPLLVCERCGGSFAETEGATEATRAVTCTGCGWRVWHGSGPLDFLTDEVWQSAGLVETANVSSNRYDGTMLNLIHSLPDGLILDCGAGSQGIAFPNVVNLEVVDYPSTDVKAVGERLPFADASFDAVVSFAVLEHVRDPFACAAEMLRVLRPGGTLYAQVPFLQPVHGYPNHYYNMTMQGLTNLFGQIDVVQSGVLDFGQPLFALSWFLNRYLDGLPPATRQQFAAMTVAELAAAPDARLGAPIVTDLDDDARATLSCTNYVIGTRR